VEPYWNRSPPQWLAVKQDWDLAQSAPVVIRGVWTMQCPQCGAETPDEEWNCVSCRMNVYWASQHYEDLAGIRQRQGLRAPADTPSFLLHAHVCAMAERAERGGKVEHKVRQIARRVMRREARDPARIPAQTAGGIACRRGTRLDTAEIESARLADGRVPRQPEEAT
jgi:hypothetical protein